MRKIPNNQNTEPDQHRVRGSQIGRIVMTKISGIYKIENSISHKVYIGQSIDVKRRWRAHIRALSRGKHQNKYLQRAWVKDGQNAFSFSILEECAGQRELNDRETFWAEYYKGRSYNLGATGRQDTMSDETKDRIRKAHAGKNLSEDHKKKISEGRSGKKHSEAEKEKMRLESKCARAIFCPELNARFFSLAEAERKLNIKKSGICHALKNPNKTAGKINNMKLHWRYE